MVEYLDVLDFSGAKTGISKLRSEVHRDGDWHLAVHIWFITGHNDILLQKRRDGFYLGNGFMEATSVGHVQAGDGSLLSAVREVHEELGVAVDPGKLDFLVKDSISLVGRTRSVEKYTNNELHDVYVYRSEENVFDLKFDAKEMDGLELVTFKEFTEMVVNRDSSLVPQWKEYEALLWYLGGAYV